jgi:hypothetical protein
VSTACPGSEATSNQHIESGGAHAGTFDPEQLLP